MAWLHLSKKIPTWLVIFIILIGLGIVVERIYWSKEPIILFGAYFGRPPAGIKAEDLSAHIKRLENDNAKLRAKKSEVKATENSEVIQSFQQEYGDFHIQLKECKLTGNTLRCNFKVTNTGQANHFYISGQNTRMISQNGNEYKSARQRVGAGDSNSGLGAMTRLTTNVPVNASIWFTGIQSDIKVASLVNLGLGDFGHIEFRNIPIQK